MGAGNGQNTVSVKELLCQPLRPGDERCPGIQEGLDQRHAAGRHIAHDPDIGSKIELILVKTGDQFNAGLLELRTHGRVDIGIAAGHAMAGGTGQLRESPHERAADADNVKVHVRIVAMGV